MSFFESVFQFLSAHRIHLSNFLYSISKPIHLKPAFSCHRYDRCLLLSACGIPICIYFCPLKNSKTTKLFKIERRKMKKVLIFAAFFIINGSIALERKRSLSRFTLGHEDNSVCWDRDDDKTDGWFSVVDAHNHFR